MFIYEDGKVIGCYEEGVANGCPEDKEGKIVGCIVFDDGIPVEVKCNNCAAKKCRIKLENEKSLIPNYPL